MVHDKVNILADKTHTQIDCAKAKEKMEYISMAHIKVCKISTSHLIGFTTTTSCRLGHCLIAAMYGMLCMIGKDSKKIWQSVRRQNPFMLSSRTSVGRTPDLQML